MKQTTLNRFKTLFEEQKKNLLYSNGILNEDFHIQKDDILDETDMTTTELEQSMRIRLRNREALYIRKIDAALLRIQQGTFGECVSCEEEIGLKRLEARPTASHCIQCKEEQERLEKLHIDSRKPKSVGNKIRLISA